MSNIVVFSLGSNLGNRLEFLQKAVDLLQDFLVDVAISPIYQSDALLIEGSPADWNLEFYNIALAGKTKLSARKLLEKIQAIEKKVIGGEKDKRRWSPRKIDIDIIAFNDEIHREKDLNIPHKHLLERDFFLLPMNDVTPDWKYPVKGEHSGKNIAEIVKKLKKTSAKKLLKPVIFLK
jgi:2-amino-4-hydroxy-6-hydroxymethyldihydropteridine diphosphokinase